MPQPRRDQNISEQRGDNSNRFHDVRTENGSSRGHNLAVPGLHVPHELNGEARTGEIFHDVGPPELPLPPWGEDIPRQRRSFPNPTSHTLNLCGHKNPYILNSKPSIVRPIPCTPNSRPQTPDSKLNIVHPKFHTPHPTPLPPNPEPNTRNPKSQSECRNLRPQNPTSDPSPLTPDP